MIALAGTQGGKTVTAPMLMQRMIARSFRPHESNEYLAVSPTFRLQDTKLWPEFKRFFCVEQRLAKAVETPSRVLRLTPEGIKALTGYHSGEATIRFFNASDPEGLESATYKGCVADEAGQDAFRQGSYEAIRRRLSIHQGPMYILTTPYNWGWLKRDLYDVWASEGEKSGIRVVRFESRMNPAFPSAEWEERESRLPAWKFDMMYRGMFTRPAGLIYDSFNRSRCTCPRFPIPRHWPIFMGVDFGNNNTAAVILAEERTKIDPFGDHEPTGRFFVVRTYWPGEAREPETHIQEATLGTNREIVAYGGSLGEDGWRQAWTRSGLMVRRPRPSDVEVQIQMVWTAFSSGSLLVFDDLEELIREVSEYSREVDTAGVVGLKIQDDAKYHLLAALRYVGTRVFR